MKRFILPTLTCLFALPNIAHAAPAMASPECTLLGMVVKEEKRIEKYEPESWRDAWGLPEEYVYHDISINVIENAYASEADEQMAQEIEPPEDCDKTAKMTTYQLRSDVSFFGLFGNPKLVGKCIEAKSKNSGDEFSYGNWLYDIQILAEHECDVKKAEE